MSAPRRRTGVALLLPVLAALLVALAACSGGGDPGATEQTPAQALRAAKQRLDSTPGVHIALSTPRLPAGVSGILGADGIGAHPPAFEGTLKVALGGVTADVPVVSVNHVVYAQLPFTAKYTEVDPGDYGAPDPAVLMSADGGLSSLLTAVQDPAKGKVERDEKTVVTTYTGTLPGTAVASFIPSAKPGSDFDVTFRVSEDNELHDAVLTGAFYPGSDDVTYTIGFDRYDTKKDITKP